MHSAELREVWRAPVVQPVAARERLEDPHVDGKRFEATRAKEQYAIGDFFADAGEQAQALLGREVGERFCFLKPAPVRRNVARRLRYVARAKPQQTCS